MQLNSVLKQFRKDDKVAIYKLTLINNLLKIINETEQDNPNYVLAKYFLEHYLELRDANIYTVADDCYVSRSSVRRFCISLGYDNFKSLKDEFKEFSHEYNYFMELQQGHVSVEAYAAWTEEILKKVPQEVENNVGPKYYDKLVERIYKSPTTVLLSSYSSNMVLLEFQRPLVLSGKIINVMSNNNVDEDFLMSLNENDCLIVVSTSGQFANEITELIDNIDSYKALITTSKKVKFIEEYDNVYYLSDQDHSNEKSIQGKYGLIYLFDMLYHTYYSKYGTKL